MNITCDNAELADILGIPQAATQDGIYVEGSDVKAEIATGDDGKRIGFADSAILSTKGTVITVTDVNNKEFSMDVPVMRQVLYLTIVTMMDSQLQVQVQREL